MGVYCDTSVWMGLFDALSERRNQQEIESAIRTLLDLHRQGKIELVSSRQVKAELTNLLTDPTRAEKAKKALETLANLNLRELPRTPADLGKAVLGEMRLNQSPQFTDIPSKPSDRDVVEYLTANGVAFFVSLDERHFLRNKWQIEERLNTEKSKVVSPQELVKVLFYRH